MLTSRAPFGPDESGSASARAQVELVRVPPRIVLRTQQARMRSLSTRHEPCATRQGAALLAPANLPCHAM